MNPDSMHPEGAIIRQLVRELAEPKNMTTEKAMEIARRLKEARLSQQEAGVLLTVLDEMSKMRCEAAEAKVISIISQDPRKN